MPDLVLPRLWATLRQFFATEGGFVLKELGSTPGEPDTDRSRLYMKTDGNLYQYPNGGSEQQVGGGTGDAALPLGTIAFSYAGAITGADSVATSQGKGWALCNGTTASTQGISNPTITATIPDFNGDGRFFRPSDAAGTTQDHQLQTHTHSYTEGTTSNQTDLTGTSYVADNQNENSGYNTGNSGSETRPDNFSVIAMMRVR